eukprot:TRINITY_DN17763_c0_g2_i1.p1 TRINITY_DN17763_c0_g2~~TRINITY_DN17763_c0_g2_i1.p1  ORF type:complete len:868 (+),score=118.28 TRINITY_DN17763_c0_g2_i1:41-2605(+)
MAAAPVPVSVRSLSPQMINRPAPLVPQVVPPVAMQQPYSYGSKPVGVSGAYPSNGSASACYTVGRSTSSTPTHGQGVARQSFASSTRSTSVYAVRPGALSPSTMGARAGAGLEPASPALGQSLLRQKKASTPNLNAATMNGALGGRGRPPPPLQTPSLTSRVPEGTSQEYQSLLSLLSAHEKAKQELVRKLKDAEREAQRQRNENQELRSVVSRFQPGAAQGASVSMQSIAFTGYEPGRARGNSMAEDSLAGVSQSVRERGHSVSSRRSLSPRTPVAPGTVVPYILPHQSLDEKYAVDYDSCLHVGILNGLLSGKMGKVCFSRFFKARSKVNSGTRCVKAVRKEQVPYEKILEQQISDMRALDHPCLVSMYDAFEDDDHVYQVFEYLAGPSLSEKILSDQMFCERDAAASVKCMLQAVSHLHSQNIAHQNVHIENMRFATAVQKATGNGSVYSDQLKLMDFGFCLHRQNIGPILNAASSPSMQGAVPPLLTPIGFANTIGEALLPPELRGPCSSYAQMAAAAPAIMKNSIMRSQSSRSRSEIMRRDSFTSEVLTSPPDSPKSHRRPDSPSRSQASSSWMQTESNARRSKDLIALLQAGDVWACGVSLHIMLSGLTPEAVVPGLDPDPIHPLSNRNETPLLASLDGRCSPPAQSLCSMLLCQQARKRVSAAQAVGHSWIEQCESIQRAHRSQTQKLANVEGGWSLIAPMQHQMEFWMTLRSTFAVMQLQRLQHLVDCLKTASASVLLTETLGAGPSTLRLPGPTVQGASPRSGGDVRLACSAMCRQVFRALMLVSSRSHLLKEEQIGLKELSMFLKTAGSAEIFSGCQNFISPRVSADGMVSSCLFADMVWSLCN